MEIKGCLQRLKEGNHKQRFILYPSLPFPYNDCKVIGEGKETTDNVLFAIIRYFYILSIYEN